jgi:hypothetical protein
MREVHVVALDLEDWHVDRYRSAALLLLLMMQLLLLLLPATQSWAPTAHCSIC